MFRCVSLFLKFSSLFFFLSFSNVLLFSSFPSLCIFPLYLYTKIRVRLFVNDVLCPTSRPQSILWLVVIAVQVHSNVKQRRKQQLRKIDWFYTQNDARVGAWCRDHMSLTILLQGKGNMDNKRLKTIWLFDTNSNTCQRCTTIFYVFIFLFHFCIYIFFLLFVEFWLQRLSYYHLF